MPVGFVGLMCHAPIVLPEVGGREAEQCRRTTRAMREVASRIVRSAPDRLVLLSPHSPRRQHGFSAWSGPHRGDLAAFGAADLAVQLPDAPEVAASLGLPPVQGGPLDHGAMVPLAFLWAAGWRGPTAILALPWDGQDGEAVGRALAKLPGRSAVLASGDGSHRLIPGAPAGFHRRAHEFDAAFAAGLARDDWSAALAAEPRELAAEDVIETTRVAMAAAEQPCHAELLSYEGPFGVGYTEAVLRDPEPPLYAMARMAIRATLSGRPPPRFPGGPPAVGVFVSLHNGEALRGCVGSIGPRRASLYEEVVESAVSTLRDGRMTPPDLDELPELEIEVSLLSPLEPVAGLEELDPRRYGVVVSRGWRRGLLLPDLEGVDTADQQVAIARRKAGIRPDEEVRLERFTVQVEASP